MLKGADVGQVSEDLFEKGENFSSRLITLVIAHQQGSVNRKWPSGTTPRGMPNSCNLGSDLIEAKARFGPSVDCDEYPFNSSREGGYKNYKRHRVSLRYIPSTENNYFGFRVLSRLRAKPKEKYMVAAFPWTPFSTVIDKKKGKR